MFRRNHAYGHAINHSFNRFGHCFLTESASRGKKLNGPTGYDNVFTLNRRVSLS